MVLSGYSTLHRSIAGLGPRYALPLFMLPLSFYPITEEIARLFSEKSKKATFPLFYGHWPDLLRFPPFLPFQWFFSIFWGRTHEKLRFWFFLNLTGDFLQILGKSAPPEKYPASIFDTLTGQVEGLENLILWLKAIKRPIFYRIFKACWNFAITSAIRREFCRR